MKNKLIAFICLLAALALGVISGVQTSKLLFSTQQGIYAYLMGVYGVCNDFGKFACPIFSVAYYRQGKALQSIGFGIVGVVCLIISFGASVSFDLNGNNKILNEAIKNSDIYQKQSTVFLTTSDSIASLKTDIAKLKANRSANENKIRNDYAPLIDTARKLKMLTINRDSVAEISKRRDADIKNLDAAIKAKEDQLDAKEKGLTVASANIKETTGTKDIRTEDGVYSLAQKLNPENPDDALTKMNIFKNGFMEILALSFGIAFSAFFFEKKEIIDDDNKPKEKKDEKPTEKKTSNSPDELQEKLDLNRFGREQKRQEKKIANNNSNIQPSITLKTDNTTTSSNKTTEVPTKKKEPVISGISNKIAKAYIDAMYKSIKADGKTVDGVDKIRKKAKELYKVEIPLHTARKIFGYLENIGAIKPEGKDTYILKSRDSIKI